jgi:hypothetical protein
VKAVCHTQVSGASQPGGTGSGLDICSSCWMHMIVLVRLQPDGPQGLQLVGLLHAM